MSFASAFMSGRKAVAYRGHRIRFRLVLLVEGVWRCLMSVELTKRVLCFFYYCSITPPAGNSGRQKGYTRHVKGYDEMKRIVSLFLKGVLVSALVIVSCACSQSGSKPSQKKGMPVAVLHSYGAVAVIDTNGT